MNAILARSLVSGTAALLMAGAVLAADAGAPQTAATPVGTAHDFDSQHGRWRTTVRRLLRPLSGAQEWAQYEGTSVVHPLVGGRANAVELDVSGPRGRIEGLGLRLFDEQTQRWSIYFTRAGSAGLDAPVVGGFGGGRHGVFQAPDTFGGKPVLVRFVIDVVDADTVRFEQSFSPDGGATWEANWIAEDKRM